MGVGSADCQFDTNKDLCITSRNRRSNRAACILIVVLLVIAYLPVVHGYYLVHDDFWGYVYEYDYPTENNMFHTQAWVAGRPIGAFVMGSLHMLFFSVSWANLARGIVLAVLCAVAIMFWRWLVRSGVSGIPAAIVSVFVFSLPCFTSGVYCVTDAYSIYGIIPAILAAMLSVRLFFDWEDRPLAGWLKRTCLGGCIAILCFVALCTYAPAAMFYWTVIAVRLVVAGPAEILRRIKGVLMLFAVPVFGLLLYGVMFALTQETVSYTQVSIHVGERLKWFARVPLGLAFRTWDLPLMPTGRLRDLVAYSWLTPTALVSESVVVLGIIAGGWRDMRVGGPDVSFRRRAVGVATKYLALLILFPLCMFPFLTAGRWPGFSWRYMVALQPLVWLAVLWSAKSLTECLAGRVRPVLRYLAIIMACGVNLYCLNSLLTDRVAGPLKAELEFYKSALHDSDFTLGSRVHVFMSRRYFPNRLAVGHQSARGAWCPGIVTTAIKELALEDSRFANISKHWTSGTAVDQVTYGYKEEVKAGAQHINLAEVIVIDMTEIEYMIDPYVVLKIPHMRSRRSAGPLTGDLCRNGKPISGGDYAGFPALQAFDDNWATAWGSAQVGTQVAGRAYIGYDFGPGADKNVRCLFLRQGGANKRAKVQRSSDGVRWHDVAVLELALNSNTYIHNLPETGPARYWRLLADTNVSEGPAAWTVYELEMKALREDENQ